MKVHLEVNNYCFYRVIKSNLFIISQNNSYSLVQENKTKYHSSKIIHENHRNIKRKASFRYLNNYHNLTISRPLCQTYFLKKKKKNPIQPRNNVSARSYRPPSIIKLSTRHIFARDKDPDPPVHAHAIKLATFTVDHSPINHSIRVPFHRPADVKRSRLVAFTWHKGQGTIALFWFTAAAEYPAHDPISLPSPESDPLPICPPFASRVRATKRLACPRLFSKANLRTRRRFDSAFQTMNQPGFRSPTIQRSPVPRHCSHPARGNTRGSARERLATAINIGEIEDVTDKSPSQSAAVDHSRFSSRFLTAFVPGFCFLVESMEKKRSSSSNCFCLTPCAGMTCHARREYLAHNRNIIQAKQIINSLLLLGNFSDIQRLNSKRIIVYGLVTRYGSQFTSCHARRKYFVPKLRYFLSFRYILSITQAKQIINLLFLSYFYPVIYR